MDRFRDGDESFQEGQQGTVSEGSPANTATGNTALVYVFSFI